MAKTWTYEELLARLKHLIGFNEGVTDQDFNGPTADSDRHFRDALNEAYVDEVIDAQQHGAPEQWFHRVHNILWPANQVTLTLPDGLKSRQLTSIADVTDDSVGRFIWVAGREEATVVFWKERDVLQWTTTGPGGDVSLDFTYVAIPEELRDANDEPSLIPIEHRPILVWSAAIIMRDVGDESAPTRWIARRTELREKFWKALSQGRPMTTGFSGIKNSQPEMFNPYW